MQKIKVTFTATRLMDFPDAYEAATIEEAVEMEATDDTMNFFIEEGFDGFDCEIKAEIVDVEEG